MINPLNFCLVYFHSNTLHLILDYILFFLWSSNASVHYQLKTCSAV